jgi:hypothetical protein
MYEPSQISKCEKCGKIIAEPKELIAINFNLENGGRLNLINIMFGSNRFIDTDGIIAFKGKEFFKYELRSSDLKPLITVEIRNSGGELLGKIWKSTSFVHCHPEYECKVEYEGSDVKQMLLIRKSDGAIVFELNIIEPTDIEINGIFHIKGFPHSIVATKDCLKIGGITFKNCTKHGGGKGINLTESGFEI